MRAAAAASSHVCTDAGSVVAAFHGTISRAGFIPRPSRGASEKALGC
jgi:hypothetical protein